MIESVVLGRKEPRPSEVNIPPSEIELAARRKVEEALREHETIMKKAKQLGLDT